jgi:hypothetical protein
MAYRLVHWTVTLRSPSTNHPMDSKRSFYILNELQSDPNLPHSHNLFPASNSYCPCFHIIPVRQEKLSAWWLGGGWGVGVGMDQSVTVSMCRNRVIVTGLPAIQPAHQLCNPSARTSIHQPENQSVRKPACKSAGSGLASYYIVKRYWKKNFSTSTSHAFSIFSISMPSTSNCP